MSRRPPAIPLEARALLCTRYRSRTAGLWSSAICTSSKLCVKTSSLKQEHWRGGASY